MAEFCNPTSVSRQKDGGARALSAAAQVTSLCWILVLRMHIVNKLNQRLISINTYQDPQGCNIESEGLTNLKSLAFQGPKSCKNSAK